MGDAHEELRKAGDRYKPTGGVMKTYGEKLADVQAAMRTIVRDAGDAKADPRPEARRRCDRGVHGRQRTRCRSDRCDRGRAAIGSSARPPARRRPRQATPRTTSTPSTPCSTRSGTCGTTPYEAALRGIDDATEGNVSDDWSDNIAGIVEVVLEVLAWAGVVLAIAALIIGGPFIALIAAIVGVIALLGTLFLWHKGRRGLGDVAWAVVGVLPFGKLGKLFQSGKRLTGLKEFLGGPYLEIATPLRRMTALRGLTNPANLRAGGGLGQRAASGLASRLGRDFSAFQGAGPRTS